MATVKIKYGDTLSGIARANGTTVAALMQANPNIKDPNRISAGWSLSLGGGTTNSTPTPQPKATTVPTTPTAPTTPTTIADRASLIPDSQMTTTDPALSAYYKEQADSMSKPIDEAKMREEIRQRYNDQFESLRLAALQKKNDVYKEGEGRMGSARALQARSGVLGSNFAGAENDQITRDTNELAASVDAELQAKISFLMGESEKDYSSQIAAAREAKRQGADEYIKYLTTRDSERVAKANNLAKLFAAQGIDPSTLSKEDVSKLESTYGVNLSSFKSMISDAKLALDKAQSFELSDGQAKYTIDPATGKAVLVAENSKNFAPSKYNGGGASGGSSGGGSGKGGSGGASTSLSYDDPNYLDSIISRSKGGRLLTQSEALPLTKAKVVLGQTETILNMVKSQNTGPIIGAIRSNNPYDTKAQTIKASLTSIVPGLARGIYGEVGVLTDSDVERYTKTIASLTSTEDVNKAVMGMTLDVIAKSMGAQLESMAAAGRDVSGYGNIYKDMTKRVNAIKGELESKTQAKAAGTSTDIKVKSPDGRLLTIPNTSLNQALKAGYVQVK